MNRLCIEWLIVLTTLFGAASNLSAEDAGNLRVYFGTYTNSKAQGIYVSRFDATTGKLSPAQLAVEAKNPSFLAVHPSRKFCYAVSEVGDFQGQPTGAVVAYRIDPTSGKLTFLNQQPSGGADPCHLIVDALGRNVLVANYSGGTVSVLPVSTDGRLDAPSSTIPQAGSGANQNPPRVAHAHSINLDAANQFAFAADLGLDKILIYRFYGTTGLLTPHDPAANLAPKSGPRHFAFHPSGKFAFVNNELASTVTSFAYDASRGELTELETLSTLPEPVSGNSTAEIVVHPSGRFVYVSNRGHDSLAIFQFDESTGRLKVIGHQPSGGKTPRNFNIAPSGQFLLAANMGSNNVVVFRVDKSTGKLTPTGDAIEVGTPVCVRFLSID